MSNLKDNLRDTISNHRVNLKNRLNIPLVTTYCIVILLYNWDIILFIIYDTNPILNKINFVKTNFDNKYFSRIWIPILLSILYTFIFPILQIGINYALVLFKKLNTNIERTEELQNAQHQFELQQNLSGKQSLEQLNNQIETAKINNQKTLSDNETLIKNNKELLHQLTVLKNEIANNEIKSIEEMKIIAVPNIINEELKIHAEKLLKSYEELTEKEKTIFADFLHQIKNKENLSTSSFEETTIFPEDIDEALSPFVENNFIKIHHDSYHQKFYIPTNLGRKVINFLNENYNFGKTS